MSLIEVAEPDGVNGTLRVRQTDLATVEVESSLDWNEVTSLELDITVAANELGRPDGSCSSTHDDDKTRNCQEALS